MHRELAQQLVRAISLHRGYSSSFKIRKIRHSVVQSTSFQYITEGQEILAAFRISDVANEYWFVFTNLRRNRPSNYYMVIYPYPGQAERSLAEINKVAKNGRELEWKYNPGPRGERHQRENRFIQMYGTTQARLSIPDKNFITAEDFLNDVFRLIEIRELAHELHAEVLEKEDDVFPEGRRIKRIHTTRERAPHLVRKAKRLHAKRNNGSLPCEVCGFDYNKQYGHRGDSFIEAHHKLPLSVREGVETRVEDLALAQLYPTPRHESYNSYSYDVRSGRVALHLHADGDFTRWSCGSLRVRGRCPGRRRWPAGAVRRGWLCVHARCAHRRVGRWR